MSLAAKEGITPLLVVDVWEHAYFLDHHNNRQKYLEAWWKVINWEWVEANHLKAQQQRKPTPVSN
jgi:Fe-Mn family superoxide dismutase